MHLSLPRSSAGNISANSSLLSSTAMRMHKLFTEILSQRISWSMKMITSNSLISGSASWWRMGLMTCRTLLGLTTTTALRHASALATRGKNPIYGRAVSPCTTWFTNIALSSQMWSLICLRRSKTRSRPIGRSSSLSLLLKYLPPLKT